MDPCQQDKKVIKIVGKRPNIFLNIRAYFEGYKTAF